MTISTIERFEAADKLLILLNKLALQKAEDVHEHYIYTYGYDWGECDGCGAFNIDCGGGCDDYSIGGSYLGAYDDEASFE